MEIEYRLTRYQSLNRNSFAIFVDGVGILTAWDVVEIERYGELHGGKQHCIVFRKHKQWDRREEIFSMFIDPKDITEKWRDWRDSLPFYKK